MKLLSKVIPTIVLLIFLFILGSLNPSSSLAQTCNGSFLCCDEIDPYAGCIGAIGPLDCGLVSSSQCNNSGLDNYCSSTYGTGLLFNNCSGLNCSCGSCNVGYVCDFGSQSGGIGPATWRCENGCCNRPASCPGLSACLPDGFGNPTRPGCASGPSVPTPPPGVTPTPTIVPPPVIGSPRPVPYVPCDEVRSPEFHSLRPYQASPCNLGFEDLALFCGNDLIISQEETILKNFYPHLFDWTYSHVIRRVPGGYVLALIEPTYPQIAFIEPCVVCRDGRCEGRIPGPMPVCDRNLNMCTIPLSGPAEECIGDCIDNQDGTETCYFNMLRVRDIAIDLQGAFLPMMGFTEPSIGSESRPHRVINSVAQSETVSDAQKVNEWVSWYINGVIGRAEYDPPDPDTDEGRRRIIDFSGPLKKLLSWANQANEWREEVERAYRSRFQDAGIRHDQVVGCVDSSDNPVNCYTNPGRVDEQIRLTDLRQRRPPLPWNYSSSENFMNAWRSWNRWPLRDLYPYVPFSSTEDRMGIAGFGTYSIQPPLSSTFSILWSSITNQEPAVLYFAHMQEGSELAELFQSIFAYEGADLDSDPEPAVVSTSEFCDLRAIRSNPGDNLFAGEMSATVSYEAQVECKFAIPDEDIPGNLCRRLNEAVGITADCFPAEYYCETDFGPVDCEYGLAIPPGVSQTCGVNCSPPPVGELCDTYLPASCVPESWTCTGSDFGVGPPPCPEGFRCGTGCIRPTEQINLSQACPNDVKIAFKVSTETPLAEDVWKRLVANPVSVFRRIFPEIEDEEGRPIRRLWDLPTATSAIYEGEGVQVVGNPVSGRPANQGELYFPHIGGVHEYFLKCIQKTLRPEGFGEGCISGPEPLVLPGGDCPAVPDSAIPGRWLGSFKANFINLANRWTFICTGPQYNSAEECYNFVVDTSLVQGVNPAFTLTIWLNESGASNYCFCGATCQDFGVRVSSIFQNLVGQLNWFLGLPFSSGYTSCRNTSGWLEPMHAFLSRFRSGGCDPANPEGTGYYNDLRNSTWQWVTGGCVSGNRYSISWPTDSSCP